jgi:hypothetical protein
MRVAHNLELPSVAVVCAIAVAACGSSAKPSSSNPTSSRVAFSKCMRANGVPNFPDLSGDRMLIEASGQSISVNGIPVNAPAFEAARQTCEKFMPHTTAPATAAQSAQATRRELEFAKCMRSHGVPNFPDPKVVSRSGSNERVYLAGVDPQSPAFQTAAKACGFGPKGP